MSSSQNIFPVGHVSEQTQIISTMRVDSKLFTSASNQEMSLSGHPSPFYMFLYHRDRMLQAARELQWTKAVETISGIQGAYRLLDALMLSLNENAWDITSLPQPARVRAMLSKTGTITCSSSLFQDDRNWNLFPASLPSGLNQSARQWLVYLDLRKVEYSLLTRHKTTERPMYDCARTLLENPSQAEEVLLQNTRGEIMEGSISTPYFWRDQRWTTPAETCGGNLGTTRRWALDKGIAVEGIIKMGEIDIGETLILSNGVHGFSVGIITKSQRSLEID